MGSWVSNDPCPVNTVIYCLLKARFTALAWQIAGRIILPFPLKIFVETSDSKTVVWLVFIFDLNMGRHFPPSFRPGQKRINIVAFCTVYSTVHCTALYTVQHCTLYSTIHCTVLYTVQYCTLYSTVHCTELYTVQHYTLYSTIHCSALYTVQHYTLYTVHCTVLYSVHCTLYTV